MKVMNKEKSLSNNNCIWLIQKKALSNSIALFLLLFICNVLSNDLKKDFMPFLVFTLLVIIIMLIVVVMLQSI